MPEADSPDVSAPTLAVPGDPGLPPPEFNTGVAHPARVYNYWLGGKDNYAADRELGDAMIAVVPSTRAAVRANRVFLGRAVRYLVREAGIRQFLDIGTGIPAAANVHEVAQSVAPESRVLYVDNDPVVLAHARALMTSHAAGATAFIQADLREPRRILADPELRATLDLGRPVALMLIAVLHFLTEQEAPLDIVAELIDALPPGSYLTISHLTADFDPEEAAAGRTAGLRSGVTYVPRSRAEVAEFFAGLDLVDPGVVPLLAWRPDGGTPENPADVRIYAAMGRKP
jgi:S-adenosyl methyltransferase